jgi:hypothetical protein
MNPGNTHGENNSIPESLVTISFSGAQNKKALRQCKAFFRRKLCGG